MSRYQLLNGLLHFLFFFMGAGIGSFLNVVIYRLPREMSVNKPRRSFCPSCQKQIPMYENIPLVSWLLLRGRCSKCASPIAFRYFGVELLTGVLFYAIFLRFGGDWAAIRDWGPMVLAYWLMVSMLVAGTFIDLEHFLLPDAVTWKGAVVGVICATLVPGLVGEFTAWHGFVMSLAAALLGWASLLLVVQLGKLAFGRLSYRRKPKSLENAPAFVAAIAARVMSCQWLRGPVDWSVSQPNEEEPPVLEFDQEKVSWFDIFSRPSDRIIVSCDRLELDVKEEKEGATSIQTQAYQAVKVEIKMETLKVLGQAEEKVLGLETVKQIRGVATELVIPREAMGMGDVYFLMMIGAFTGWQAVLFTVLASSLLGTVLAGFWKLIGKSEWTAKIPFGPYIAAGALIWLFRGPEFVEWYLRLSRARTGFLIETE